MPFVEGVNRWTCTTFVAFLVMVIGSCLNYSSGVEQAQRLAQPIAVHETLSPAAQAVFAVIKERYNNTTTDTQEQRDKLNERYNGIVQLQTKVVSGSASENASRTGGDP